MGDKRKTKKKKMTTIMMFLKNVRFTETEVVICMLRSCYLELQSVIFSTSSRGVSTFLQH